jgi:glutaredoxin
VSSGSTSLTDQSKKQLKELSNPVHIQVFVTPTCPYCTRAALTAFQLAQEYDYIRTDVVEVSEFPHLAQKYNVMGVPKVVINEEHSFEGALPESMFIEKILGAIKDKSSP